MQKDTTYLIKIHYYSIFPSIAKWCFIIIAIISKMNRKDDRMQWTVLNESSIFPENRYCKSDT